MNFGARRFEIRKYALSQMRTPAVLVAYLASSCPFLRLFALFAADPVWRTAGRREFPNGEDDGADSLKCWVSAIGLGWSEAAISAHYLAGTRVEHLNRAKHFRNAVTL